jgi:hypothetical protein
MFRQANAILRGVTRALQATPVLSVLRADVDYGSFGVVSCCGIFHFTAAVEYSISQLLWNIPFHSCCGIFHFTAAVEYSILQQLATMNEP